MIARLPKRCYLSSYSVILYILFVYEKANVKLQSLVENSFIKKCFTYLTSLTLPLKGKLSFLNPSCLTPEEKLFLLCVKTMIKFHQEGHFCI